LEELIISQLWSFQGTREIELAQRENAGPHNGPVSQNSTANDVFVEVDVDLGEPEILDG
jgi:hypothetical protein